ncbi:MAG: hypothetical protein LBS87_01345, partial [Puniceicoccales bacterium]|nr:hypothetical protein [Puniceicoccales bacterium]
MIIVTVLALLWQGKVQPKTAIKVGLAAYGARSISSLAPSFYRLPLQVLQAILSILQAMPEAVYALFGKNVLDDLKNIVEEVFKKVTTLQKPQREYQSLNDPELKLGDGEMGDILSALAIAGGSRGDEVVGNYCELKESLKKRGYLLVEPGKDFLERIGDAESKEKMRRFLNAIKLSEKPFKFENGIIKTDFGMQATVVYDPDKKMLRVFYHGTDFDLTKRGRQTIKADLSIATDPNGPGRMADDAIELAQLAKDAFGDNSRLSGHSLGGGLCQIASAHTGIPGIS